MREWMEACRKKANLTMREVADALDISESYYSLIESGERQKKMDITLVAKLAVVFKVSVDYIISCETAHRNHG